MSLKRVSVHKLSARKQVFRFADRRELQTNEIFKRRIRLRYGEAKQTAFEVWIMIRSDGSLGILSRFES